MPAQKPNHPTQAREQRTARLVALEPTLKNFEPLREELQAMHTAGLVKLVNGSLTIEEIYQLRGGLRMLEQIISMPEDLLSELNQIRNPLEQRRGL
jgi:hypothetical protein